MNSLIRLWNNILEYYLKQDNTSIMLFQLFVDIVHLFWYEMKQHVFSKEIKFCYCSCISSSATRKKLSIKISIDFVIDEHENPFSKEVIK